MIGSLSGAESPAYVIHPDSTGFVDTFALRGSVTHRGMPGEALSPRRVHNARVVYGCDAQGGGIVRA